MGVEFRAATLEDAGYAAGVVSLIDPGHSVTEPELRQVWADTDRTSAVRRFIVSQDGSDRGWFSFVKPSDESPDAVYLRINVPDGEAEALAAVTSFAESVAAEMEASRLLSDVWERQPGAIAALEAAGWEHARRQRYWRLVLAPNARRLLEEWAEARARMAAGDIAVRSAADLGGEAEAYPKLYEVGFATYPDVPSSTESVQAPYEDWLTWMKPPRVLPERVWVACDGDRFVGYSFLVFQPSLVHTGYTGVLREYRGRGIARALKLETLAQAVELGVEAVETDNDSTNEPILHLNAELGYDEIPGAVELMKRLG